MAKVTFQSRLERVKKSGRLTTADLSVLFARPYATVRSWLAGKSLKHRNNARQEGYEPWGPNGEAARAFLPVLERAAQNNKGLPVPVALSPPERVAYVKRLAKRLRHDGHRSISSSRSAG